MPADSRRRSGPLRLAVSIAVIVLAVGVVIPSLNPFKTERLDRSQPAVLKAIEDLGELRSSSANLQIVVDVEDDTKNVPSFLKGERVLFVAGGRVDGSVSLKDLGAKDIVVSDDRRTAKITLPRAVLGRAQIDPAKTRVYNRERGIVDRIEDLVGSNPNDEQELYVLAGKKLEAAAAADPEVLDRAEENTRATLTGLLKALGFTDVTITFAGTRPGL
ncbi:MAG: DUF4230 domain-containing protein [Solirubrobacteraceae bacterium]|nr:DUF4230 domain-containing protein [Solirubrobacteraceae bacterium]